MDISLLGPWQGLLQKELQAPYFEVLTQRVEQAYAAGVVYPPREDLFTAFQLTPPQAVRAVILGQDPYHGPGQAHGLAFSVNPGVKLPPSLKNMYKEYETDLGRPAPETGDLRPWAKQGVLLLNTSLSVEAGKAGSHEKFGWQTFTDGVIAALAELPQPICFVLWGAYAQKKLPLLSSPHPRLVLQSPHPSPLSSYRGFFGSRPYSQINAFLQEHGEKAIDW